MRKPLGLLIFISALLLAACGIKSDSYPTNIVTKVSLPQEGNADRDPAKLGAKLYSEMGCISCHSVDGRDGPGPSFKGLFSKDATVVTDGVKRKVKVDEEWRRRQLVTIFLYFLNQLDVVLDRNLSNSRRLHVNLQIEGW